MTPFEDKIAKLKRAVRALRELADEVAILAVGCVGLAYFVVSQWPR